MVYRINEDCIACGDCSIVCSLEAIDDGYGSNSSTKENRGQNSLWQGYRITDACNNCGECRDICPTGAIVKG